MIDFVIADKVVHHQEFRQIIYVYPLVDIFSFRQRFFESVEIILNDGEFK